MKSDKYFFMRNISRIRGRIIAKTFPDCRNLGMLNYRTVVCVHSIIGSSNHFLITSVFSLASVLLGSACVKHAGDYGGYLEI